LKSIALFVVVMILAPFASAGWHERTEAVMGTRIHVEIFAEDDALAAPLLDQVVVEMHRIDHAFSPYKEDSELSRLNREAPRDWMAVSDEMMDLLTKSHQISDLSGGAFDVTYASVGRYYDYRKGEVPDSETLERAVQAINYRYVERDIERQWVRYSHPHVYVDLGGIAKGHAVDRAIAILEEGGVTQASVAAGGDSRIIGDRAGQPWTVGIQHPRKPGEVSALLPLADTAVSTSGDYERYFERDGVRYHHILDPATGRSADGAWSVTILGPEATFTDALSTSVFVLGPDKGLELINRMPGVDAIIIDPTGRLLFSDDLTDLAP
jgi:thiamine biosynthesis lipoprotein